MYRETYTEQDSQMIMQIIWQQRVIMENFYLDVPMKYRFHIMVRDIFASISKEYHLTNPVQHIHANELTKNIYEVAISNAHLLVWITLNLRDDCESWAEDIYGAFFELKDLIEGCDLKRQMISHGNS